MKPPPSATTTPSFELCPPGLQQAVCCDAIDCGIVMTTYAGQEPKQVHKVRLRWQSAKLMKDGKPYLVQKQYTWSMHEKANLRKELESWRGGVKFTEPQARDFDLDKVIGKNCYINVVHTKRTKGTYADISVILPCPKELTPLVVREYVRMKDRPKDAPPAPGTKSPGEHDRMPHQPPPVREPGEERLEPPPDIDDFAPPEEPDNTPFTDDDIPFAWFLPLLALGSATLGLLC